jgi:tetratricopeptide (TPR) repeat protein
MSANEKGPNGVGHTDTGGGAHIGGDVRTGGGDFVGRDQIGTLIRRLEEKTANRDYVERQEIVQIFVMAPDAQEEIAKWLADQQGVDKRLLQNPVTQAAPEHIDRQIEEVEAAQKEATARGVTVAPEAAYQMGMLAAYRRDYDGALDYFRQATQANPEYYDAFESIAWLQQSRAMDDIGKRNYDAAIAKLAAARTAAAQTDPLDAGALALRGYIAKTLAQISEARQEQADRKKYYAEAARMFEGAAQRDPRDPSAQNGLGNVQHALGNLDAAIEAYGQAIKLAPRYTAAHHDLALAYEDKMRADPDNAVKWCQKALAAWRETYHLAPHDPSFSADNILQIGNRILWLEQQCG